MEVKKISTPKEWSKINAKNLQKSIDKIAQELAIKFRDEEITPILISRYGKDYADSLLECLKIKKGVLSIEKVNPTFFAVWQAIEWGIKDKGIKANPIIRLKYPDYKKILVKKIDSLIAGKE